MLGFSPFQAHLLFNRGIRHRAEVEPFLAADERSLNDPLLLPDMDRAVARLRKALASGESIGIFGDFDTDGVTGTALLARALGNLGAKVLTYLPDRDDEGHGLNERAIRVLRDRGVSLLVTVDCGATSNSEVRFGASLGIDTVITDHHTLHATLPEAIAVINPKRSDSNYPYAHLTGGGHGFQARRGFVRRPRPPSSRLPARAGGSGHGRRLGAADRREPLPGKEGFEDSQRYGEPWNPSARRKRWAQSGVPGHGVPRLRSHTSSERPGRLEHASISLDLLTATTPDTARPLADRLERANQERRSLTDRGVTEAQEQVETRIDARGVPPIIIVSSQDWMPGILGLIAGRLAEQYHRPAVAIARGPEVSRGSARSIPEFDIVDALRSSSGLFIRFGGHPQAAGFTVPTDSLPDLERQLGALAHERLRGMDLAPMITVDCEVSPALLTGDHFAFVQSLSPFGQGNPAPVFMTRNVRVVETRQVGDRGEHLMMRLSHSGAVWGGHRLQAKRRNRQGPRKDRSGIHCGPRRLGRHVEVAAQCAGFPAPAVTQSSSTAATAGATGRAPGGAAAPSCRAAGRRRGPRKPGRAT